MVREDLIAAAVSFLQDPSVAAAPLDKRIAFLKDKNLTQEEVDISLARVGESPTRAVPATVSSPAQPSYAYRQAPPPPLPGYGGYQNGYWQQPPPPELPKRDWRDWFIMATVTGGIGYGLYFTAKRYILPLIAPPTPPQITQDKASIDESFDRAFALLDQLNADTTALKASEEARTQRLDTALSELESVLASLKESDRRRDDDTRRNTDEVRSLRDLIPKALDARKEATEARLKDLNTELKGLKTLIGNRMAAAATTAPASAAGSAAAARASGTTGANTWGAQDTPSVNGSGSGTASPAQQSSNPPVSGGPVGGSSTGAADGQSGGSATLAATAPDRAQSSSPYGRLMSGRAAIPAWQMAAAKKSQGGGSGGEGAAAEKKDTAESGTVADAGAGA